MFKPIPKGLRVGIAAALSLLLFGAGAAHAACSSADLQGIAVPKGSAADRTVTVTPATMEVKVKFGETVKFQLPGGQEKIWRFIGTDDNLALADILAKDASKGIQGQNLQVRVVQVDNPMKYRCRGG